MAEQLTLLDMDWNPIQTHLGNPEPEYNTQYMDIEEPVLEKLDRQRSQKDEILRLLQECDLVPISVLLGMGITQYNARINRLNKELAEAVPPQHVVSVYQDGQYYKRLELVQDGA